MSHKSIVLLLILLQAIFTNTFFAEKCHDYCGLNSSTCLSNGRCLCYSGWTGPNAAYITSGPREGMIVADFCTRECHYNFLFHNPDCVSPSTTINPPTTHPAFNEPARSCEKSCGKFESAGRCLTDEKCLCWWGWTGNNAMYINDGLYKNRIVADDCMISCHYTHDYRNPDCIKDTQEEATPTEDMDADSTQTSMTSSSSSNTNPISDIITNTPPDADTITVTSEIPPSPSTPGYSSTQSLQAACDPKCERFGQGKCLSDGSCLCWWGWTGPNATYITTGNLTNRIKAKYCTEPCHYTHDYMNTSCATIPTPKTCSIPSNSTPQLPCLPRCGEGVFHGECLRNGRCLCWWGWTGPHSCFIDGGEYNNRIIADYCNEPCHYTHDYRNKSCVKNILDEAIPTEDMDADSTQPSMTSSPSSNINPISDIITNTAPDADTITVTSEIPPSPSTPGYSSTQSLQTVCDPKCERFGQGKCLSDGSCLCWWGWTGPNATYITTGNLTNRIKAKYCTEPCHYTHDYMNTSCATIPTPKTCSIPSNSTPQLPCLPRCGAGVFHGECLRNGRCLCWWGWTGPHSCFIDGGEYNNRIIADYCEEPCHYTHDYRNESCVKNVLEYPMTTAEQPTMTEQLTTTEEQPTTTEGQPTVTEQLTTTEEQPTTTAEQHTTTAEQPTVTEQLTTTEEQPTKTEEQPTTTAEQPNTTEEPQTSESEMTQPIESSKLTRSTEPTISTSEPTDVVEPSETESAVVKEPAEATELTEITAPTEGRESVGFTEPTDWKEWLTHTEPTEETDLIEPTEPSESTEVTKPTAFAELTEATEPVGFKEPTGWKEWFEATEPTEETDLIEPTEPSESTEVTKPTVFAELTEATEPVGFKEPTDWKEWFEATKPTEETGLIEPTEPSESGPNGFAELTEATETEATELTEVAESTQAIKSTESTEAIESTEVKSTKQVKTTESTDLKMMDITELEESNHIAQDLPASKEQSPAVSSKKHSSASSLSLYMVAFGIIAIIFAVIGLAAMVKHHGKWFKRHVGYSQLGDNAYFVNEREMSDELSQVI